MQGKIYINGVIGDDVTLVDVIGQVQKQSDAIGYDVFINSPGGVCDTGFEIYDFLQSIKKPITTIGINAVQSIATVVFMAGSTRLLRANTDFMVHLPMIDLFGFHNSNDLENAKNDILAYDKKLLDFYKKNTGMTEEALAPLLKNETTLNPENAINLKFATGLYNESKAVAYLNNNFKKNEKMTQEDKSWIENLINGSRKAIVNLFEDKGKKSQFKFYALAKSNKIVNVEVTDANGTIITFADVADGSTPVVGDKALIDGEPAEGEYLTPTGDTMVFVAGELTQVIKPEEGMVDVEALNAEIADLKSELSNVQAKATAEIVNLKKQITTKFNLDKGTHPNQDSKEPKKRQIFKTK